MGDHANLHGWNDASGSRVLFTAGRDEFDPYTETLARARRSAISEEEEEAPPDVDDDDGDVEGNDPFFTGGMLQCYKSLPLLTI